MYTLLTHDTFCANPFLYCFVFVLPKYTELNISHTVSVESLSQCHSDTASVSAAPTCCTGGVAAGGGCLFLCCCRRRRLNLRSAAASSSSKSRGCIERSLRSRAGNSGDSYLGQVTSGHGRSRRVTAGHTHCTGRQSGEGGCYSVFFKPNDLKRSNRDVTCFNT